MNDRPNHSSGNNCRYRFGTAEFDEARFELRVAGLPVEVERRALEVLACLLRRAGEVVTKEELFRQAWAGRITVDKVLPNAVNKLRRALGEANSGLLLTVPRVGYRLDGVAAQAAVDHAAGGNPDLAPGRPVPARANFILERRLGGGPGRDVWLAAHAKTGERRVYKFCAQGEALHNLKREATLSRVLQDSPGGRRHFADIIDWSFDTPPRFLECEYGGQSLLEWARGGGLAPLAPRQRLELFLQIADAVAAAHQVGVLHKDLKPANILIAPAGAGWHVRLTDFGSAALLEPDRLAAVAGLGLTLSDPAGPGGTPLYLAPEVLDGQPSTARSDVFALGLMLYQLLAGNLNRPLAPGWEEEVGDELLCEDIRLATAGDPERRLAGAAELAARLRRHPARREQALRQRQAQEQARQARETLARGRARRPYLAALVLSLAAALAVTLGLLHAARRARDEARHELQRAAAIDSFLAQDLINPSNPQVAALGGQAALKDILLSARSRVDQRFGAQPLTAASIHFELARWFDNIEQIPQAEGEFRAALSIYAREEGPAARDAMKVRTYLVRYLSWTSQFDRARVELDTLQHLAAGSDDPFLRCYAAAAAGLYHLDLGDNAEAIAAFQLALRLAPQLGTSGAISEDALRSQLTAAYENGGHTREAKAEATRLLGELRARGGGNELYIALTQHLLARAVMNEGDYSQAEALTLAARKAIAHQVGANDSVNLELLSDLADIAARRKQWREALQYAEQAHAGLQAKFGDDDLPTNILLANWGQYLYESGDARGAESRLAAAYGKLDARYSHRNPQTQSAALWLAAARLDLGQTEQAAALLGGIDENILVSVDSDELWRSRLAVLRALLLQRRGRTAEARALLHTVLDRLPPQQADDTVLFEKARRILSEPAADAPTRRLAAS